MFGTGLSFEKPLPQILNIIDGRIPFLELWELQGMGVILVLASGICMGYEGIVGLFRD